MREKISDEDPHYSFNRGFATFFQTSAFLGCHDENFSDGRLSIIDIITGEVGRYLVYRKGTILTADKGINGSKKKKILN